MSKRERRTFSAQFKLEATQLVVSHGYSVIEAAKAMNLSQSAMGQLKQDQQVIVSKVSSLTPELIQIRELKRRLLNSKSTMKS